MHAFFQDLRYTVRTYRKNPVLAGVVILMLALGIGGSTAIFSVVNGVLLRPLPYADPSRLVFLGTTWGSPTPSYTSVPDFIDWKNRLKTVEALAASQRIGLVLTGDAGPERVEAVRVSPGFFNTLGVAPDLGRAFSSEEGRTGAEAVAILSHGFWQTRWGGDPNIVGAIVHGDDARRGPRSLRVIGVLPAGFQGPAAMNLQDTQVWLALPADAAAHANSRTSRSLQIVGRLKPGVSLATARQEIDGLAAAMAAEYPDAYRRRDDTLGIGIASLLEMTVGRTSDELLILLGASALLLFIACANVANLLLARANERDKEVAVRSALGAGRARIVRQLLTESIGLGALGGIGGILFAFGAVETFRVIGPTDFPRLTEVAVDTLALALALGLALITGILFGLAPALLGSRSDPSETLREGYGRVSPACARTRLRSILVAAETGLALVVLAGAGLLVNSYLRLQSVDPGFNPDQLLLMEVGTSSSYSSDAQRAAFFRQLTDRVEAIPGVASASSIVDPPIGYVMWSPSVYVEGATEAEAPWINAHMVGPGYFKTMSTHLLSGRPFSRADDSGQPLVAIVNQTMAREFWPGEDPLGQRIRMSRSPDAPWVTIVGVVNDICQGSLAAPWESEFYVPYAQHAWFGWNHIIVRTELEIRAMASAVRGTLWELDPNVPFDGVTAMNDRIAASLHAPRFRTMLLTGFAVVALLLAAGGMYATMLYAVGQRTREIGIRLALGGDAADVLYLVLRQGMKLALFGIATGLLTVLATSRVLESFVFEIETTDPLTLAGIAAVVAIAALAACYIPARKATRVDPMIALRKH